MKIKRFEDAIAWQKGQDLAVWVYQQFGGLRDFSFKDQICRASVSISNNFAEGFDRNSDREFLHYLFIARGSNSEVKSMCYLAHRLQYIDDTQLLEGLSRCDEVGKIINGFISSILKTQPPKD
jgi:four helix bundle protein